MPKPKPKPKTKLARAPGKSRKVAAHPERDPAPTLIAVENELLATWDADTWLRLSELKAAYDKGWTLNDVGIKPIEAESYVNKYNSVIVRSAKVPVLVKPSEAEAWVKTEMRKIVATVHQRAGA